MSDVQTCKLFLTANDILTRMYPGYITAVVQAGVNTIISPAVIHVTYGAGSVAFGGNPSLQIGVPDLPDKWSGNNFSVGLSQDNSRFSSCTPPLFANQALLSFVNQPLVFSLVDATAAQAPILTWALSNAGTGYTAGDDLTTNNGSTIHVGTVNGSGVILTSSLTVNNPELVGVQALSGGSGSDAELNVLTTGPQGNGNLYVEFEYQIITVPFPIH